MTPDSNSRKLIKRYVTVTVTIAETGADGHQLNPTCVGVAGKRDLDWREIAQYGAKSFEGVAEELLHAVTHSSEFRNLPHEFAGKVSLNND